MKYNNENLKNITAIYLQTQIVIASRFKYCSRANGYIYMFYNHRC